MLEKIRNGSESVHSLGGFWIGIGRNLFLNQLKKDQRIILVEDVYDRYGTEDTSREWILQEEEENDQMERAFSRLGEKCREILLLWINRYTMIEIAQHMNLANDNMARKIKYECFKKLKEIVKTGHISHG
jgi:RNA polymerase sigma factor (sigma-70 family)